MTRSLEPVSENPTWPETTPLTRLRSMRTPAALSRSCRSWTLAARGPRAMIRPTTAVTAFWSGENRPKIARWSSEAPPPPSTWWLIATRWRSTRPTSRKRLLRASRTAATSVQADLAEQVEVGEHLSRPQHHRGERVLGHRDGQPRLLAQQAVQVLEQGAPPREDDPAVHDVGGELGGRALQGHPHRVHDEADGLGEGLPDLGVGDGEGLGDPLDQVAPLDLHGDGLLEGEGAADLQLDLLRGALP